jgi:predicted cation transporter
MFPKSLRMKKLVSDDEAAVAPIAAGAVIGFAIGIVIVLVLTGLVFDQVAAAKNNSNADTTDKALLGLYKIVFLMTPLLGAVAGAYGGRHYG